MTWPTSTWPTSLDQLLSSPAFPMWLTLAAAAFFGVIVLITLVRAERSVANGALTVITLLAVGIAVTSTMREFDAANHAGAGDARSGPQPTIALPALACVDDLAGDLVLSNCEKPLFGSADSTAAAVSYAAAMITRLTATGDVATANKAMTPDLLALRRAVERDHYGLMAYVLLTRDHCTPSDCAAFRAVTDRQQLAGNMEARTYEGLVTRYAPQWNAPPQQAQQAGGLLAGLASTIPTGKPTNADFPSAASTPPISIMTPEPTASTPRPAAPTAAATAGAAPAPAVRSPPPAVAASHAQAPAKKTAAPKPKPPATTPEAAETPPAAEQQ
jgi:hypothetical protein